MERIIKLTILTFLLSSCIPKPPQNMYDACLSTYDQAFYKTMNIFKQSENLTGEIVKQHYKDSLVYCKKFLRNGNNVR